MFEKVNPSHPDKVADRIAGSMVDLAYANIKKPKVALEVMIGHGKCHIIGESSYVFCKKDVEEIVERIDGKKNDVDMLIVPQDAHLARNARRDACGDNGIFKGAPVTTEQRNLTRLAEEIYRAYPYDGKYLVGEDTYAICQSHTGKDRKHTENFINEITGLVAPEIVLCGHDINPIGPWEGGTDVDTGCTNRKLGSDMGDGITGGGLHGKDLSKADVTLNIIAFLRAQTNGRTVELSCAIGDEDVDVCNRMCRYSDLENEAKDYIDSIGGFEALAEWGLIR